MKTQYIEDKPEDNPITHWNEGGLVVVPTETVYGLSADASNDQAVAKIYALKQRPSFNPLIAHVAHVDMAKRYVAWNGRAEKLASQFWPGALTLVLPLKPNAPISKLATDGGDTLAVRVPAHNITRDLIAAFDKAIVAPSANRSGKISPTKLEHVRNEFGDGCPLIVDGGACEVGIESSVIDLTGEAPVLLRAGVITIEAMANALGEEVLRLQDVGQVGTLKSPGLLTRHYAPNTPLRLNAKTLEAGEALLAFGAPIQGAHTMFNLSEKADLLEAAANLFEGLRALDASGASSIAVMPIADEGIGEAINDRLKRAAASA